MAITYTDNGGGAPNGSDLEFTYTFPVIQTEDVKVALNGVTQATTKYAVDTASNPTKITFNNTSVDSSVQESTGAPKSGVLVRVFRQTTVGKSTGDDDPKAVYAAGSSIRATDLNANTEQALYAIHELQTRPIETEDIQDSAVTSSKIEDGTIVNADISASAAIDGSKLQTSSGSVAGSMSSANFTKLAGIETGATADQTASEIRTLVESASDSNVFTDADHTKLDGIETAATADQTGAEIKTAYEAESNTNAYTDAEKTKLTGIATGAEVNVNADWNASSGDAQILNKPTLVTGLNALSDVDTSGVADGKILKYDSSSSAFIIADDGGGSGSGGSSTFTGLSDTPANFGSAAGKTLKVNSAGNAVEFVTVSGSDVVDDTTPQLGGNLDVQDKELNTSTTDGNIKLTPNGTGKVEVKGNTNAGSIQLNCENNSHGVTIKGPAHSAAANYTLTLPPDDGDANEVLKTDGNGGLDWTTIATDKIEEGNSKAEILDGAGGTGDFRVTLDNNQVLDIQPTVTNLGTASAPNHLYTYGDIRFSIGSGVSPYIRLDSSANLEVTGAYGGGSSIGSVFKFGGYQGTHVSGGNINPSSDSTYDLGTNTVRWQNIYADTLYGDGSNITNLPASSYNIQINTLSSSSGSGGGSATFNGTATRFTLSNAGTNAQAHLVSVNGVIQKPNTGTSPSEGFAIDGNDIIFASAPASGADYFILTLGNSIGIGTPSDNTVNANKLTTNAVTNAKILDDTISEAKLNIHAAPSGTDKVLGYTANGMEWVVAEAGATGGGTDKIFYENGQTVTTNYTITNNTNAMSAGPVTINNGVAVTIGTGENWTIV